MLWYTKHLHLQKVKEFIVHPLEEIAVAERATVWLSVIRYIKDLQLYVYFICTLCVRHKKHQNFFYHNFYNTWLILIEIDVQCNWYAVSWIN